ncbi:hypothetical protein [Desulfotomaculum sp. 1211_IL3151]|uniref:hypothetical protein n=1 Tax=Desulfotomaculum sp. 1211_IL3151 TaxID=3084055 RepID=UPI002FDA52E9
MGNIPFYLYLSLAILEGISVFYFVFTFTKITSSKSRLILYAIIYALLTYLLRKLPISFGIHSLILICLTGGYISYYYKVKLSLSLFGMILAIAIIFFAELTTALLFTKILSKYHVMLSKPFWWFVSGLPHIVLLILIAIILRKIRGRINAE